MTDKEQCWDLNKQKSRSPNVKHLPLPPGKAIVIFANGDKYVGGLQNAQKEGDGMCSWLGSYLIPYTGLTFRIFSECVRLIHDSMIYLFSSNFTMRCRVMPRTVHVKPGMFTPTVLPTRALGPETPLTVKCIHKGQRLWAGSTEMSLGSFTMNSLLISWISSHCSTISAYLMMQFPLGRVLADGQAA